MTEEASVLPFLGTKGYGKGNFRQAIPPPEAIPLPKQPAASSSAHSLVALDACQSQAGPDPIAATQEDIDEWLATFTPFDATNDMPPEIAQKVLWRGFKVGRSGNPSTALEYFNGTVHDLHFEGTELYVYVT